MSGAWGRAGRLAAVCVAVAAPAAVVYAPGGGSARGPTGGEGPARAGAPATAAELAHARLDDAFPTSDQCVACHDGIPLPGGGALDFGADWRASMMANSARDPYWQAAMRREVTDHPDAAAAIEDECSTCHMPLATTAAHLAGERGQVFANLPVGAAMAPNAALAADGVSCGVCHRIRPDGFGTHASFTGGFVYDTGTVAGAAPVYGPFDVDEGRVALMRSASGHTPVEGAHVQASELCATCHTLYTHPLGEGSEGARAFPEQVPYLEWRASEFADERSCQDCHMPVLAEEVPIASVLGVPRSEVSRHVFRGGNFFMLGMLARHRDELGVEAPAADLVRAAERTVEHLATASARLTVEPMDARDGRAAFDVVVENLAGHKLPTAYPSRRAWLHVVVHDGSGRKAFESGAVRPDGSVAGLDADADADAWEPHHAEITQAEQVQVYESILGDARGRATTGLLVATTYLKDNRIPPRGFDPSRLPPDQAADVAVHGRATSDTDFRPGSDRVRYRVPASGPGPWTVTVTLRYQPIGFRWARNLAGYDAPEPQRFIRYWDGMAEGSSTVLAEARATLR